MLDAKPVPKPVRRDSLAEGARVADAAMRGDVAKVRSLIAARANVNTAQGDGMTGLHWAAERGDLALAELLMRSGAKPDATSRIGSYTPLHIAAKNGHGAIVKALLRAGGDVTKLTDGGATALHLAAAAGDGDAVTALVQAKADPNAREGAWGQTPLMFAAAANRGGAITALLRYKADPKIATRTVDLTEQASREQAAARKRNEVMVSFLPQRVRDSLKAVADSTAAAARAALSPLLRPPQPSGATNPAAPVSAASAAVKVAAVQGAVTPAAGVAAASAGATATPPAVPLASSPAGGALQALAPPGEGRGGGGAQPPAPHLLTATQIQQAIEAGREQLTAPQKGPITVSSDTSDGQVAGFEGTIGGMGGLTALHHATRQGNIAATLALLDGGADINQRTLGDSTTPLLMATINGHFDLAMQLVQRGADVKLASIHGATPLYAAINTQWLPRSRFPQPQSVQNQKTTHLELMEAMITAGADVNLRLKKNLWYFGYNNCGNANCGLEYLDGTTPFWRAAYSVDVEAMRLLKKHGADHTLPSLRVAQGRGGRGGGAGAPGGPGAPGAAAGGAAAVAGAPGAARGGGGGGGGGGGFGGMPGAALDPVTDSASKAVPPGIGVYPIHAAAGVGYGNGFAGNSHRHAPDGWMPSLKYLVEELGADVNQRDVTGYTPLHHAAARGDNAMILYLVSKGADVKAVS
ncbi:MAG TPA: ankyrin repeat domain-containing protein, partial [Gemmatimonadaceae bacterium]|nr:ankyrin repeat domain-containing protein [Gemmatimonadaceae bacterium]